MIRMLRLFSKGSIAFSDVTSKIDEVYSVISDEPKLEQYRCIFNQNLGKISKQLTNSPSREPQYLSNDSHWIHDLYCLLPVEELLWDTQARSDF